MSRNLYLGADVYAAARFLPDLQAASQYLWDNMQQTLFVARADAFADEVMRTRPDVIGLQEAATWYCRDAYAGSARIVYDYTQLLIDALDRRGLHTWWRVLRLHWPRNTPDFLFRRCRTLPPYVIQCSSLVYSAPILHPVALRSLTCC
jgi:hypothetical protein